MELPLTSLPASSLRVFDLSRPLSVGMPQSPSHPEFRHVLVRRHGDMVRADGGSAANDLIVTGTHVGTHVDALGHVSHEGRLFGDADAEAEQRGGGFRDHGIHRFDPYVGRGVLLDVPATLGVAALDPAHEITPEELAATVERQGTPIRPGDAVLIRSGWAQRWDDGAAAYVGHASGVPGIGPAAAAWLADLGPVVLGADTIAFERLAPGAGHALLPVHRILLVERGINIVETMDLEALAAAGGHESLFVLNPLNIVGATGAPVRPLAVLPV
jgi:kynurenine formamidase